MNSDMELVENFYIGEALPFYEFFPSCQNKNVDYKARVRYVRLQTDYISRNTPFQILEIKYFDLSNTNVAQGKSCSSSSILNANYSPAQIADGKYELFQSDNSKLNEWVEVDLIYEYEQNYLEIVYVQDYNLLQSPYYAYAFSKDRKVISRWYITGEKLIDTLYLADRGYYYFI